MDSREISKIATKDSLVLSSMGAGYVNIEVDGTVTLDGVYTIEELQKIITATSKIQNLINQR